MKSQLLRIENIQGDIFTLHFSKPAGFRFTAGQFTEITLPHPDPDARGIRRWFTLSSSPDETDLTITTRKANHESSSFKKAIFACEPGDEVEIAEAMGDFVLPKSTDVPVVLVAGGIGITPIHSMLAWLAQHPTRRDIRLLWSVRTEEDIIFQDTFKAAGIHATIVVSDPSAAWGGVRGRLTADKILGIEQPSDNALFYLSGPEAMLEVLSADLQASGVQSRQIVTDFFPGYDTL